jgi:hypothetical protein
MNVSREPSPVAPPIKSVRGILASSALTALIAGSLTGLFIENLLIGLLIAIAAALSVSGVWVLLWISGKEKFKRAGINW